MRDPEAIEILFDSMRRGADAGGVRPGTTIQWDFADAEPWHLALDNGGSRASRAARRAPT